MKKGIKACIIATIITCLIIVSTAFALPAHAENISSKLACSQLDNFKK